jgi:hypothetical protein
VSASIASRLLIPNPITEKHKFYNELLYELFNDSYELMTHDAFILYVTGQRQSRWKIKQRLDSMRLYEIKLAESKDGHWQNIRKYVGDQVMLTSKDMKPAERCVEFMAGIIQEVDSFIVECKTLRSNLFDKENTVKSWKANELLFLENIIKDLSAIDAKMVKAKGDIFQNVCYLRRRVLESEAIQHDNSRSNRRMKENKRKSSNRKEQRKLRSCCKVLQEIIGLTDDAQEMIAKVDKGDFTFTIDNSDIVPEKLLALKPKTHKSGLLFLIEKNVFVSGSKEMAEEAVNNMDMPKRSSVLKKRKTGQQMSIESAFANAVCDPSDNSSNSSDDVDEDDYFPCTVEVEHNF